MVDPSFPRDLCTLPPPRSHGRVSIITDIYRAIGVTAIICVALPLLTILSSRRVVCLAFRDTGDLFRLVALLAANEQGMWRGSRCRFFLLDLGSWRGLGVSTAVEAAAAVDKIVEFYELVGCVGSGGARGAAGGLG